MEKEKHLGIMMYIDNSSKMLEEFSWIYKSWIYSGCYCTSDLIVVHHPDIADEFPDEPGIILIPCLPASVTEKVFNKYAFINSIACLVGDHIDPISSRYPYLLRTDADVFLTKNLAQFKPNYPVYGRGNYHRDEGFRAGMLEFCARHNVKHHQVFGCGHSIMADAEMVIVFLKEQIYWSRILLEEFGDDPANWGTWPGWTRGVTSMYAAEITANREYYTYLCRSRERILDMESNTPLDIDLLTLHIHCSHSTNYFSKFHYRQGEYDNIDISTLDRRKIDQYCHWICAAQLEQIKEEAGYPF